MRGLVPKLVQLVYIQLCKLELEPGFSEIGWQEFKSDFHKLEVCMRLKLLKYNT